MMIEDYFKQKGRDVAYVSGTPLPSTLDAWMVIASMQSLPDIVIENNDAGEFPNIFRKTALDNGFNLEETTFLSLPTGTNSKGLYIEKGKWLKIKRMGALNLMDLCIIDGEPDFVIINETIDSLMAITTEEHGLYIFLRDIILEKSGFIIK